jgi:hypothetical protein
VQKYFVNIANRWENDIKINFAKVGFDGMDFILLGSPTNVYDHGI